MLSEKTRVQLEQIDVLRSLIQVPSNEPLTEIGSRLLDSSLIHLFNKARNGTLTVTTIRSFLEPFIDYIPEGVVDYLLKINENAVREKELAGEEA